MTSCSRAMLAVSLACPARSVRKVRLTPEVLPPPCRVPCRTRLARQAYYHTSCSTPY